MRCAPLGSCCSYENFPAVLVLNTYQIKLYHVLVIQGQLNCGQIIFWLLSLTSYFSLPTCFGIQVLCSPLQNNTFQSISRLSISQFCAVTLLCILTVCHRKLLYALYGWLGISLWMCWNFSYQSELIGSDAFPQNKPFSISTISVARICIVILSGFWVVCSS